MPNGSQGYECAQCPLGVMKEINGENRINNPCYCVIRDTEIPNALRNVCLNMLKTTSNRPVDKSDSPRGPIIRHDTNPGQVFLPWVGRNEPQHVENVTCVVCERKAKKGIEIDAAGTIFSFCGQSHYQDWWLATQPDDIRRPFLEVTRGRSDPEKNTPVPFARSYWVIPSLVLAGYYPGDSNKETAKLKLSALLDCGIRCFVNLVEENESTSKGLLRSYERLLKIIARNKQIDVTYIRIPVRDMSVPSQGTMQQILDTIESSTARNRPVYVHCLGGIGRTGTVVGCLLLNHGAENGDEALSQIADLRKLDPAGGRKSPETPEQVEMVRTWLSDR